MLRAPFATIALLLLAALAACSHPATVDTSDASGASVTQQIPKGPMTPLGNPALLPPLTKGDLHVHLVLLDREVTIADGVRYASWTFNGGVPGPVVHARVGQKIDVTLTNRSQIGHSIDFHSALAPPDIAYQTIAPGETIRYSWTARYPGVFLYHCGTPPVLMHISNGMYGAVVVDPPHGWGPAATSYVLLQSEFYLKAVPGHAGEYVGDMEKMKSAMPDVVAFNGDAMRYEDVPLPIHVGGLVRLFLVNAGPSHFMAFHVVGSIFDRVLVGGNPHNELVGMQTIAVPPGSGAEAEFTVHQVSKYPFLTHSFGDADAGAMGNFSATLEK